MRLPLGGASRGHMDVCFFKAPMAPFERLVSNFEEIPYWLSQFLCKKCEPFGTSRNPESHLEEAGNVGLWSMLLRIPCHLA